MGHKNGKKTKFTMELMHIHTSLESKTQNLIFILNSPRGAYEREGMKIETFI
jgi:hypothetical protein